MRVLSWFWLMLAVMLYDASADSADSDEDWLTALIVTPPGKTFRGGEVADIGEEAFNTAFQNSEYHILRLELDCDTCDSYKALTYFRRFTDPSTFEPYKFMGEWTSDVGQINVDYALYSTLDDALSNTNAWTYCNYDDPSVGAFRDCGPYGFVGGWQMTGSNSNARAGKISIYKASLDDATDCAAVAIDYFLTECSDEFASNEVDIESLQSAQTAAAERLDAMQANITANDERMNEFATAVDAVDETIESVQSRLEEIEAWKKLVMGSEYESVQSARARPFDILAALNGQEKPMMDKDKDTDKDRGTEKDNAVAWPQNKDTIIAVLVAANVVLIIGCFAAVLVFSSTRQMGYGKVNPPEF